MPTRASPCAACTDEEAPTATTKLHIEVSPEERCALKISMDAVECMEDLQDLVAEVCDEAGYSELDALTMSYKRPDGEYANLVARQMANNPLHN